MLIGIVTIVLVGVLIVSNKRNRESAEEIERQKGEAEEEHSHTPPMACCGAHEVCEAETLLALSDKIIYYDDEELDAYRGRSATEYTDAEVDEWREILLTLQTHEVAGWLRSLSLRGITPPEEIREEALMIVSDFREERPPTENISSPPHTT